MISWCLSFPNNGAAIKLCLSKLSSAPHFVCHHSFVLNNDIVLSWMMENATLTSLRFLFPPSLPWSRCVITSCSSRSLRNQGRNYYIRSIEIFNGSSDFRIIFFLSFLFLSLFFSFSSIQRYLEIINERFDFDLDNRIYRCGFVSWYISSIDGETLQSEDVRRWHITECMRSDFDQCFFFEATRKVGQSYEQRYGTARRLLQQGRIRGNGK